MLSSIRKMYEIYYFMKKITLIIMEGAQFDQSIAVTCAEITVLIQYSLVVCKKKSCRKPYISIKSKIWSSTHFFFIYILCLYTNKYNMLCRFYVILFVHFYILLKNTIVYRFILLLYLFQFLHF